MLLCIHDHDDVGTLMKLLETTYSTKESPNEIYVLHLMEFMGRTSPIFVSHQKMVRKSFENVILAFTQYQHKHYGAVTVNAFKAISDPHFMHEDICMLALDKQVCLILLPFHQKWRFDGTLESGGSFRRNLNCSVVDKTPCSVGILVPSPAMAQGSTKRAYISVGMLFFGGRDDHEVLALAKRTAKNPYVRLTVIHFVADVETSRAKIDWDSILDAEQLKEVKHAADEGEMLYMEEAVKDGPAAALVIRQLADGYDLMIIGRRYEVECAQTSGLSKWSESPELGVVGDLLASTDISSRVSTLIVQQPQHFQKVDQVQC